MSLASGRHWWSYFLTAPGDLVCHGAMDSDEKREKQMSIAWIIFLIILLLIGIGAVLSVLPAYNGIAERSPRIKAISDVKMLAFACRSYAADYEGVYPGSLAILYPDYIDNKSMLYARDIHGTQIPMIYHPGFKDTGPSRDVLIEHPLTINGTKVIGYVGGNVVEISAK